MSFIILFFYNCQHFFSHSLQGQINLLHKSFPPQMVVCLQTSDVMAWATAPAAF